MASDKIPSYLKPQDNNWQYDWNSGPKWEPASFGSSSPQVKKTVHPVPEEKEALFLAKKLDKLDGFEIKETKNGKKKKVGDGKITKENWNNFADSAGIPKLKNNQMFITVEEAEKKLQELKNTNPNLFYDLPERMGLINTIKSNDPNNVSVDEEEDDSSFWAKSVRFITKPFHSAAWEAMKMHVGGEGAELMDDPDKYIDAGKPTVKEVRKAIKEITAKAADYPLSKKLLELSVSPELTYLRHKYYNKKTKNIHYRVLDETQTRKTLNELNIPRLNENPIKTILFEKNTEESKIVSNDDRIKEVAELWLKNKNPNEYYTGGLNKTRDTAWSINKCYFAGIKYTDNGNSYTVTGYVEDVYDFEEKKYNDTVTEKLNHLGVTAQKIGAIEPYRVLIPFSITIPKN